MSNLERCPVCYGRGIVPEGFYSTTGLTWVSNGTGLETCKACQGKGYLINIYEINSKEYKV